MKKVLLASSSKVFLKRNTELLMRRGFELFSVTTGEDSLKLNREHDLDLVLADIRLEDMGGETLCSLIRREKKSRDVPIVLICHNIPGSIDRVAETSANAMLIKPVDPIQLITTIGKFIGLQLGRTRRAVIKVIVISKILDLEFVCFSHDISSTGILIESEHPLDLGCRITCKFSLPGTHLMEIEGEVVRFMNVTECDYLYGIKFINLPLSCCRLIDNYIYSGENSVATAHGCGGDHCGCT
jgi:CheY-like chemotaxis protein